VRHRHLVDGYADTVASVEDVLDRGTVADWSALAATVRAAPHGRTAASLAVVLAHTRMYGTTRLWRRFLERLERVEGGQRETEPPRG